MTSNYPHKKEVLEALELAEKMTLITVGDDRLLKESLFKLGRLFVRIRDGKIVSDLEVEKTLKKFYSIDPDMIEMLKGNPDAFTKIT